MTDQLTDLDGTTGGMLSQPDMRQANLDKAAETAGENTDKTATTEKTANTDKTTTKRKTTPCKCCERINESIAN